jgi:arylsulfatase A-like enzyme
VTKRPNFLLIITDQHRADHLGCYGNPVVKTPHIDAIAARGTRFEQFYVATPICMPNRATLMTGRLPSLHGSRHNGIPLSLDATTFVQALAAVGWKTGLMGKCHLQSMSANRPERGMPVVDPALTSLRNSFGRRREYEMGYTIRSCVRAGSKTRTTISRCPITASSRST